VLLHGLLDFWDNGIFAEVLNRHPLASGNDFQLARHFCWQADYDILARAKRITPALTRARSTPPALSLPCLLLLSWSNFHDLPAL
jgi:hypothetical protein